jgi:hypothetical protein
MIIDGFYLLGRLCILSLLRCVIAGASGVLSTRPSSAGMSLCVRGHCTPFGTRHPPPSFRGGLLRGQISRASAVNMQR